MRTIKAIALAAALVGLALPAQATFSTGDSGGVFRWAAPDGNVDLTAAGWLTLSDAGSNGPFQVDSVTYAGWYAGPQFVYEDMLTWCIESEEVFAAGVRYWFTMEPVAYGGGIGAAGDPVGAVTEYIYDAFKAGNPQGWSNTDIRDSIWYAEDTGPDPGAPSAYDYAVNTALINPAANASHTWALNLWTIDQDPAQDGIFYALERQSHIVSTPAPGALLLGSLGIGAVGWLRRRHAL